MAKTKKEDSAATLGFEAKLWHAADLMRGKLPATQYRQVLMGLLFLRYVSDAFENRYRELKAEGYGDEEDRDILGRTYEYCIQHFAEYEGKKGGEYYTPQTIVRILVEVLQPAAGMRIYDPCHGSGGMFSQSMKFIETHSGNRGDVAVFGQEANPDTWKMSKINMAIRGIGADFGMGHMVDRTHRAVSDEDIAKIAATFEKFRTGKFRKEEGFAAVATTKEIAEKKFKLTPGLYAGGKVEEDDGEPFKKKMRRLTGELKGLFGESAKLEAAIRKNLKAIGYGV